ncbi:hypothetical protein VMCG_00505 [Cytospora schulzeri]|uniref:Rhodopsin domain-containing protein n=1 Tax=Cytospora schulzeri TaxID=448051 RepID=A0A423X9B1_9PEZI|nr:hypothetical protein VMCG_00505 [Valsa malicola]
MSHAPSLIIPREALNLSGPSLQPPAGVQPQLDNPPNRNDVAVPVIVTCIVVSSVLILVRIYSKLISKEFHLRDSTGLAFKVFYWPCIYYNWCLTYTPGWMVHQWDISLKELIAYNHVTFVAMIFYTLMLASVKIAILLEFTAIFVPRGTRNYFFWISYLTIGVILVWNIIGLVFVNANCYPYKGNWDPFAVGRFCRFNMLQLGVASAAGNFVFDIVPLFLPQKIIWGLNASMDRKVGVSIIFLIGILGCTSALIRLVNSIQLLRSADTTYVYGIVGMCGLGEATCGILVLCVPFIPKAVTSTAQTRAFASLKSWTASFREPGSSRRGPTWPSGSSMKTRRQGVYHKFSKQPLATQSTPRTRQHDPTITRVTRISMTEEYNPDPGDIHNYYLRDLPSHDAVGTGSR